MVVKATGLPAELAESLTGVIRPRDARHVYAHPDAQLHRLVERGRLHRLATGYYAIVPPAEHGARWLPSIEASGFGIAAADYGFQAVVLMGLSAARMWGALPRAIGVAVVATPKQRPVIQLRDRAAQVHFVCRDAQRLHPERVTTDLGAALVTSPEQTALDLAHRPDLGGLASEARSAAQHLLPRCDPGELGRIATEQRLRAALGRLEEWAG